MDLHEITALVTGASQGLGLALSKALAAGGARVAMVARHEDRLRGAAAEVRAAGGEVHPIAADVGDKRAIHRIVGEVTGHYGPVDVLVHAASTLGPTPLRMLDETECEDLERVLQINLVGPFRLTKAVLGAMAVHRRGVVVSVSSDAAVEAYPTWGAYSASKAALDHLTRIWAAEVEPHGVRLFAVDPGEMNTQMHRDAIPDADPATLQDPADVAARILDMIRDPVRAPSGSRQVAPGWELAA